MARTAQALGSQEPSRLAELFSPAMASSQDGEGQESCDSQIFRAIPDGVTYVRICH